MKKIIARIKQFFLKLPENMVVKKYLIWAIILEYIASILPSFSYDGIQVIKYTYITNNISWPPQLNAMNLRILRDLIFMNLILFIIYIILVVLFLFASSFIVNKVLNLFKRDVGFLKLCNISLASNLFVAIVTISGWLLLIPYSFLFNYYRAKLGINNFIEPFMLIWQIGAYILIFGGGILGLILYIFGIRTCLKKYSKK